MRFTSRHLVIGLTVGAAILASVATVRADEATEARIKAAIVYNFTKFVTWPDGAITPEAPCVLGVVCSSSMQAALAELEGKPVGGQPLEIVVVDDVETLGRCRVVYFGRGCEAKLGRWLEDLATEPVLTIGDLEGFTASGGIIELVKQRNRIRFAINRPAAEDAELRLSSQLLKMAVAAEGG